MKKSKKLVENAKPSDLCPICGDFMDIYCTGHRNKPFVDDKCYPKICFTCFWVPKTSEQKYDSEGGILEDTPLEYSHKNLHRPEELLDGQAEDLAQAKRSVKAVINAIKKAGLDGRKKAKAKSRPSKADIEINPNGYLT